MIEPAPSRVPGSGTASGPMRSPTATPLTRSRRRAPWFACTSAPTVQPSSTVREAVPMPPLKPWQIMPVPPPTLPSAAVSVAASSAVLTCSGRTWKPLMSLRKPSHVSPTTGRLHASSPGGASAMSASRTTPTECVLVSPTGVVRSPESRIHSSPVSSPLPLMRWQPAKRGSGGGRTTVTPVRTSSPSISVVWPTRTPATSVIVFRAPRARRPMSMPSSCALGALTVPDDDRPGHPHLAVSCAAPDRAVHDVLALREFDRQLGPVARLEIGVRASTPSIARPWVVSPAFTTVKVAGPAAVELGVRRLEHEVPQADLRSDRLRLGLVRVVAPAPCHEQQSEHEQERADGHTWTIRRLGRARFGVGFRAGGVGKKKPHMTIAEKTTAGAS